MVDTPATTPIVVSESQGIIDLLAAAGRYITVIVTLGAALLAILKTHDIAAIIAFMRGTQGAALIAAVMGLGALGWGLYKTHKRGAQVATVAASSEVPNKIAKIG